MSVFIGLPVARHEKETEISHVKTSLFSWMSSKDRIFWEGRYGLQPFLTDICARFFVPVCLRLDDTVSLKIRAKLEIGTLLLRVFAEQRLKGSGEVNHCCMLKGSVALLMNDCMHGCLTQ